VGLTKRIVGGLLGAILLLQVGAALPHLGAESTWPDEAFYLWAADHLFEGRASVWDVLLTTQAWVPVSIAALVDLAVCNIVVSGRLMALGFALAATLGVFRLGREVGDCRTGLLSSLLFAAAPVVVFQSTRTLMDLPLAALCVWTALAVLRLERDQSAASGARTGVLLFLCVLTKSAGALMLPVVASFWLCRYGRGCFTRPRLRQYGPVLTGPALLALVLVAPAWGNIALGVGGAITVEPFWTYARYFPSNFGWGPTLLIVPGLVLALRPPRRDAAVLAALSCLILFCVFSLAVAEKSPRYILPAFALSCALVGLAPLSVVGRSQARLVTAAAIGVALAVSAGLGGLELIQRKRAGFTGFAEIGSFLRETADPRGLVFAGSRRQVRLFSGLDYQEFGGRLAPLPERLGQIDPALPSYIVLDAFEKWNQPDWALPFGAERFQLLRERGFVSQKEVWRRGLQRQRLIGVVFASPTDDRVLDPPLAPRGNRPQVQVILSPRWVSPIGQ